MMSGTRLCRGSAQHGHLEGWKICSMIVVLPGHFLYCVTPCSKFVCTALMLNMQGNIISFCFVCLC